MPLDPKTILKVATIGEMVVLTLLSGETISGTITELGLGHLIVDKTLISLESIASIRAELEKNNVSADAGVIKSRYTNAGRVDVPDSEDTQYSSKEEVEDPKEEPETPNNSIENNKSQNENKSISQEALSLYFRSVEKVRARTENIQPSFPVEPSYKDDIKAFAEKHPNKTKDLEKIWSSYENAKKIKELHPKFNRSKRFVSDIEALLEGLPYEQVLLEHIVYFCSHAQIYDKAEKYALYALAGKPSANLWFTLAWVFSTTNKFKEAISVYYLGFNKCNLSDNEKYWWEYVSLLQKENCVEILNEHTKSMHELEEPFFEASLFLLSEKKLDKIAQELAERFLKNEISLKDIANVFELHIDKIHTSMIDAVNKLKDRLEECRNILLVHRQKGIKADIPTRGHLQWVNKAKREGIVIEINSKQSMPFVFSSIVDLVLYSKITCRDNNASVLDDLSFIPSVAGSGWKATELELLEQPERSMNHEYFKAKSAAAVRYAEARKINLAIHEISELIKLTPEDQYLQMLLGYWKKSYADSTMPKGTSPYARAIRAKHKGELLFAQQEFIKAINEDDNRDKAIVELALTYSQECNFIEALNIIESYHNKCRDKIKLNNTRINILLRAAKHSFENSNYKDSEQYYRKLLTSPRNKNNDSDIMAIGNIAICLARQGKIEQSKSFLADNISGRGSERLQQVLESLEKKDSINLQLLTFDDFWIQRRLSVFASYFVDSAESEGYEVDQSQENDYDETDITRLGGMIEATGYRKPETRADLLLTSARILKSIGEHDRSSLYIAAAFRDRGRHAYENEKLSSDIPFSWFAEALFAYERCENLLGQKHRLSFVFDKKNIQNTFVHIIYLHAGLKGETEEDTIRGALHNIGTLLPIENKTEDMRVTRIFDALAWLSIYSKQVISYLEKFYNESYWRNRLFNYLNANNATVEYDANFEKYALAWDKVKFYQQNKVKKLEEIMYFLATPQFSQSWLNQAIDRVSSCSELIFLNTDREYLNRYKGILVHALSSCSQTSFELRDHYCVNVLHETERLLTNIHPSPTKFSIEHLRPTLNKIYEVAKEYRKKIFDDSVPKLTVALDTEKGKYDINTLSVDVYLTVRNEQQRALAEDVRLYFVDGDGTNSIKKSVNVKDALRGGDKCSIKYRFRVTADILKQPAAAFTLYLTYKWRDMELVRSERIDDIRLTVQLSEQEEFKPIPNPYKTGADGRLVREEEMFYGRDDDVDSIVQSLVVHRDTGNCEILYGQKRSGKSSVMFHVKNRLEAIDSSVIIVDIGNIGKIEDSDSNNNFQNLFLWEIIDSLRYSLENYAERKSLQLLELSLPEKPEEFLQSTYCRQTFNNIFKTYQRNRKTISGWENTWVALFIDEFTYIYNWINEGTVSESFMQFWKAILQEGYFSAFIVGQDFMPVFIERFPNEMQVMGPKRISYLQPKYAEALITEPMTRVLGKNPYRGESVQEIIRLTGGSPWYIQIICDRIIKYINRERLVAIQEADITEILRNELLSGNDPLLPEHFDNLLSSGEKSCNVHSSKDVRAVLQILAENSRSGDCARSDIIVNDLDVDAILDDLIKRGVVTRITDRYRINVELFKEWLIYNKLT